MTTTERSRTVMQQAYADAAVGNIDGFFAAIAADVVVTEPAFLPYGGRYVGVDAFKGLLGEIAKYLDLGSAKVDALVADGDTVVACLRANTVRDGSEVRLMERAVVRNEKIVSLDIYVQQMGSKAAWQ